jgi:ATP-dependent DNA ligase
VTHADPRRPCALGVAVEDRLDRLPEDGGGVRVRAEHEAAPGRVRDGAESVRRTADSTRYPGGLALRFARVVRYRDDKSAAEADTIETVRSLAAG